jgi:hypothetical protein
VEVEIAAEVNALVVATVSEEDPLVIVGLVEVVARDKVGTADELIASEEVWMVVAEVEIPLEEEEREVLAIEEVAAVEE